MHQTTTTRGLVDSSPFEIVKRPKANYRQSRFLNAPQAASLAKSMGNLIEQAVERGDVQTCSFAFAVRIALATGMRRGEIFALRWEDIDTKRQRIAVSKAIKADGKLGQPKSQSSVRSVAIGEGLSDLTLSIIASRSAKPSSPVIADAEGAHASMNAFGHWWRRWADANGFEGLRFHELRHSHATLLISSGTDVKTVQMRLGHASAEITMSIYAHAIPQSDAVAAMNWMTSCSSNDVRSIRTPDSIMMESQPQGNWRLSTIPTAAGSIAVALTPSPQFQAARSRIGFQK